ncbi:MAG: L-threonylcarbamoyladenylate synthase [Rikenellaceae bacterium]
MLLKLYSGNPNEKIISQIIEHLRNDGVIIYPTDSMYAFACSLKSSKAVEKIKDIKFKQTNNFSLCCDSLSRVAEYVRINNDAFAMLKTNLPGAFTFILKASSKVPDKALRKRKTIGVRIPDNDIARAIVEALDAPLLTTSIPLEEDVEYSTDPELIFEKYGQSVAVVVDGGIADGGLTTVVDFSEDEWEIVREGKAELKY